MKRIYLSLVTIAIVLVVAVGFTGAYFTDQESIEGNSFTAGIVDIAINVTGNPETLSVDIDNLAPGVWTEGIIYKIYDLNHSLPVKYKITSTMTSETVLGFNDKINVRVRHIGNIPIGDPTTWTLVYDGKLKDLSISSVDTLGIVSPTLAPNKTHHFYTEYQLDPSIGNEYANASSHFDLLFDATQTNNPGWN